MLMKAHPSRDERLAATVLETAAEARGLLQLVDALRDQGILSCIWRKDDGSFHDMDFVKDDEGVLVEASTIGLSFEGRLSFSKVRHGKVFDRISDLREEGFSQPRILDEAGEVALDCGPVGESSLLSGIMSIGASNLVENPDAADRSYLLLQSGYDCMSRMDEGELRQRIRADIIPGIDALDEPYRLSALRWAARISHVAAPLLRRPGRETRAQEIALHRQQVITPEICTDRTPEPSLG